MTSIKLIPALTTRLQGPIGVLFIVAEIFSYPNGKYIFGGIGVVAIFSFFRYSQVISVLEDSIRFERRVFGFLFSKVDVRFGDIEEVSAHPVLVKITINTKNNQKLEVYDGVRFSKGYEVINKIELQEEDSRPLRAGFKKLALFIEGKSKKTSDSAPPSK